jgi:hypothetical protein
MASGRRDVGVLGAALLAFVVVAVISSVMAYQAGRVDQRHADDTLIASLRAEAFQAGRLAGDADAVGGYTVGVATGACRVSSTLPPVPAPTRSSLTLPRDCRLLKDGSLWVPAWRPVTQ